MKHFVTAALAALLRPPRPSPPGAGCGDSTTPGSDRARDVKAQGGKMTLDGPASASAMPGRPNRAHRRPQRRPGAQIFRVEPRRYEKLSSCFRPEVRTLAQDPRRRSSPRSSKARDGQRGKRVVWRGPAGSSSAPIAAKGVRRNEASQDR